MNTSEQNELLKEFFNKKNLSINKIDGTIEKTIILNYKKKQYIFIHLKGLKISNILKCSSSLKYFCNGQVLKGNLKTTLKETLFLNNLYKDLNKFLEKQLLVEINDRRQKCNI